MQLVAFLGMKSTEGGADEPRHGGGRYHATSDEVLGGQVSAGALDGLCHPDIRASTD
jgi:hypothetical protein